MIIETFRQALQNVWSNKLRTFLTMLGIIIGVMAVIVIVGLGNGMTQSMRDSFSALGTNALSIQVWATVPVPPRWRMCIRSRIRTRSSSPQSRPRSISATIPPRWVPRPTAMAPVFTVWTSITPR